MAVKIRLQRKGRTKAPFYHIVIADARSPRDGKFIQKIGTYNPMTTPASINIDRDAAFDWIMKGAQPTDTIRAILRFKGVMYKKHLHRGISKGVLTPEVAEEMYQKWISDKDAKVATRIEKTKEETAKKHERLSGTAKVKKVKEVEPEVSVVDETPAEEATPVAEESTPEVVTNEEVAPAAEEVNAAEATTEPATEEAPEVTETPEETAAPEATEEEA
jgi:small subunit ribosomal protein S16